MGIKIIISKKKMKRLAKKTLTLPSFMALVRLN